MKRISRGRPLTPEEAAKYKAIREQIDEELPDLIARHHKRMATLDRLFSPVHGAFPGAPGYIGVGRTD